MLPFFHFHTDDITAFLQQKIQFRRSGIGPLVQRIPFRHKLLGHIIFRNRAHKSIISA